MNIDIDKWSKILKLPVEKVAGHKERFVAEFIALKARGLLTDAHLLPGDNLAFVNWAKTRPAWLQAFMKQVFDGFASAAHAMPDSRNIPGLVVGEIASEIFAQSGYVMTHADKEELETAVDKALPIAESKIREETRKNSQMWENLSKVVRATLGTGQEWDNLGNNVRNKLAGLRSRLK